MRTNRSQNEFADWLQLGLVQTTTDADVAWDGSMTMSSEEADGAWHEITRAFQLLKDGDEIVSIVLCPELALPGGRLNDIRELSTSLGCIIITGSDYHVDQTHKTVSNKGYVIVPKGWPQRRGGKQSNVFEFGKTYPAPRREHIHLSSNGEFSFAPDPIVWIFDAGIYGRLGLCICYDLMDLERALMYRTKVHHFLVIAYNQDVASFTSLAESFSRSVFCNVVICNTGHYGGSIATSPYYKPYMRTIYRHEGQGLFTVQTLRLPVKSLNLAQSTVVTDHPKDNGGKRLFKQLPPGFPKTDELRLRKKNL